MLNVLWWVGIAGGLALVFDTLRIAQGNFLLNLVLLLVLGIAASLQTWGDRDMNYDLYTSSSIF